MASGLARILMFLALVFSAQSAFQPRRRLLQDGGTAAHDAFASASTILDDKTLKLKLKQLMSRLLELKADARNLHLVLVGDNELRAIFPSACASLMAEITDADVDEPDPSSSCVRPDLGIFLAFVPARCGKPTQAGQAMLHRIGSKGTGLDMTNPKEAAASRIVVLSNFAKEVFHLGTLVPLRCPAEAADFTEAVDSLLTQSRQALLPSVPEAMLFLGPATLCVGGLPPYISAAVHDAQSANRRRTDILVDQCTAVSGMASSSSSPATIPTAATAADPLPSLRTVCANSLLTANAVEELSAESEGAMRVVADRWGPHWEPRLGFVDVHRLTRGHCDTARASSAAFFPAAMPDPVGAIMAGETESAGLSIGKGVAGGQRRVVRGGDEVETGATAFAGMAVEQCFQALAADVLLEALSYVRDVQ